MDVPQRSLSKDVLKVWRINEAIEHGVGFILLGVLLYLDYRFAWKVWIGWILLGLTGIAVLSAVWSLFSPAWRYANWRYDVDEEFLQLKSGVLFEKHELVPMTKIQSVATEQGPLLRKYRLYSVSVETMGSSHTIPGLSKELATKLRGQIAQYAKIKEVEQ